MPATPEAVPLLVTPSTPSETAFVPELWPVKAGLLAELVTVSRPATEIAPALCVMIELFTLALPPLLEKSGTKPVLQAVPDKQTISFACSARDPCWLPLLPALPEGGATIKAETGRPPRVSASSAFKAYGTLTSTTRGCSAPPFTRTPSQRASPELKRSSGKPAGL